MDTTTQEQVMTPKMPAQIQNVIDRLNNLCIAHEITAEQFFGGDTKISITTTSESGERDAYAAWWILEPRSYDSRPCRRVRFIGGYVYSSYAHNIVRRMSSRSALAGLVNGART